MTKYDAGAILFDLDGTLADTLPDLAAAVNRLLAEQGRPPLSLARLAPMVGDGTAKLVERAFAAAGLDAPAASALARFLEVYAAAPAHHSRPYPGVPEGLAALASAGWRLGLCTNKPEGLTRAVLAGLDLARFFGVVLGGDTLAVRKPDPAPLLAALARLGVPAERAVMVGDHRNDVAAAKAAGIAAVFARYGYGRATLGNIVPAAAIDRFAELPGALALIRRSRSAPSGA